MLHIVGDIHFSDMTRWNHEVGNNFIKWFDTQVQTSSLEDELLLEGDVFDREINSGQTMLQVKQFFDVAVSKYKKVYAIIGNHEVKVVHQHVQHPLMFLSTYEKVHLIEKPEILDIQGIHTLTLPFMRFEDGTLLYSYYEKELEKYKATPFDLIAGHVNEKDPDNWLLKDGVDLTGFDVKHVAFGHIHTRISDHYTGSVWAVKISEEDTPLPRQIQTLEKVGNELKVSGIDIPKFLHYEVVDYPDPLPNMQGQGEWCMSVFRINGLASIMNARDYYHTPYIHSVVSGSDNKDQKDVGAEDFNSYESNEAALDDMIQTTGKTYSRSAYSYVKGLLQQFSDKKEA